VQRVEKKIGGEKCTILMIVNKQRGGGIDGVRPVDRWVGITIQNKNRWGGIIKWCES
jgi:hypothetical protein